MFFAIAFIMHVAAWLAGLPHWKIPTVVSSQVQSHLYTQVDRNKFIWPGEGKEIWTGYSFNNTKNFL
jgi:hypothetical protein